MFLKKLLIIWKHLPTALLWCIIIAFRIRIHNFRSKSVKIEWNFIKMMAAMLKTFLEEWFVSTFLPARKRFWYLLIFNNALTHKFHIRASRERIYMNSNDKNYEFVMNQEYLCKLAMQIRWFLHNYNILT